MTINAIDALNKLAIACDPCNETMELVRTIRAALSAPAVTNGGLQDFACKVSDMLWGGELGWARTGLDRMFNELKKRISSPAVPVIPGLEEAIEWFSDKSKLPWLHDVIPVTPQSVHLDRLLQTARAYVALQKGEMK